ncbi:fructosamine kinase family protein [Trichothermofontia sichuanensis B231]|uniref:fructosamine kinase family protein n=1 Tax=Trichothermofontia sichuanensis TaxID=3045816 RepID=UPI0022483E1B|nr:fructosamine kinase family protein [Trichothermofontia sichuanensis]UZQ55955.1 fructosamine kinase family protein [Trichothermofontia sichuanensis B231]
MWTEIAQHITQVTGTPLSKPHVRSLGGGCINQAYLLNQGDERYFVKLNHASKVAMFEAEQLGLAQMAATQTIRVPRPICCGVAAGQSYLVLEYLNLGGTGTASWHRLGQQLAALHQWQPTQGNPQFGWDRDNTIGATPQPNPWTQDWATFFRDYRLAFQLQLAARRGGHFPRQAELLAAVPQLLADHHPQPSLVHGDLWSGNAAITIEGEPVIFDPATYWGDREVDLAMSELFGRFPAPFYQGYNEVFPIAAGYEQRQVLYNLYHILNHFNLFGGSYAAQANRMIEQLLRHL